MNTSNGYGPIAQPGTSATFDLGAQPVNSTSAWICVGVVQARVGNIGQAGNGARPIAVQGLVGAGGALAHFKITQAAVVGGAHNDLAVDTDFATGTEAIPICLPSSPETTAAGGSFQVELAGGAAEYGFWAQAASATTTLEILGTWL
jgi:hypothetical protein